MNVFIINLIVLGFWSFLFRKRLDPQAGGSKAFLFVVSLQLSIVVGLSPLVSDAIGYTRGMELGFYGSWEPGWVLFSKGVWSIVPDGKALVLATSVALVTCFARFTWRYSRNMALSYLLFICLGIWGMSFYILRQSMALSILLLSIPFIEKRRPVPFLALVLIASLFHQTAIIFLLLYPLSLFRRDALYHFVAICTGLFLLLLGPEVASFLVSFARIGYELTSLSGEWYLILLISVQIVIAICTKRERDGIANHMIELGSVLQVVSLNLSIFTRAVQYFSVGITTSLPNALLHVKDNKMRVILIGCMIVCMVFYYAIVCDYSFPGGADAYVVTLQGKTV